MTTCRVGLLVFMKQYKWGFPGGAVVKNLPVNAGDARDTVRSLEWEDPLE